MTPCNQFRRFRVYPAVSALSNQQSATPPHRPDDMPAEQPITFELVITWNEVGDQKAQNSGRWSAVGRAVIVLTLCAMVLALYSSVEAQQAKKAIRIGWLSEAYVRSQRSPRNDAFLQGLRDLGYIEGQNIVIEHRSAQGKDNRLPDLAAELVRLKVKLIVALEPPSAQAAKNATGTIPIVMRSTDDPVETGLVDSLARPGGNITGVTSIATALIGKRLELLREVVPQNSRIAVLWNPDYQAGTAAFLEAQSEARTLGIQIQSVEVRGPGEFEKVFKRATEGQAGGILPLRSPLIVREARRIAELAVKNRLPAVHDDREFVDVGGLMSYGTDLADLYRRAAVYVDKI